MALLFSLDASAAECFLHPESRQGGYPGVLVRSGRFSFHVDVSDINRVDVRLPRWPGDSFRLKISGAVDFEGSLRELPLKVGAPIQSLDKMVMVTPHSIVSAAYSVGNYVVVTLAESGCFGQKTSESVTGIRLPCKSLQQESPGVRFLANRDLRDSEDDEEQNETWATLKPGVSTLRLNATASFSSNSVMLSGVEGDFRVLERRGNWLRVRRWWTAAEAMITGWVPRYLLDLQKIDGIAVPISYPMCEPPLSELTRDLLWRGEQKREAAPVSRSARAHAGAKVYGRGGPWGTFTEEMPIEVALDNEALVRILEIPGLSGKELQAWINRSDLVASK